MTIGAMGDIQDFQRLAQVRENIYKVTGLQDLELSMGMSEDFLDAIRYGSTNVRVGSRIFGSR